MTIICFPRFNSIKVQVTATDCNTLLKYENYYHRKNIIKRVQVRKVTTIEGYLL